MDHYDSFAVGTGSGPVYSGLERGGVRRGDPGIGNARFIPLGSMALLSDANGCVVHAEAGNYGRLTVTACRDDDPGDIVAVDVGGPAVRGALRGGHLVYRVVDPAAAAAVGFGMGRLNAVFIVMDPMRGNNPLFHNELRVPVRAIVVFPSLGASISCGIRPCSRDLASELIWACVDVSVKSSDPVRALVVGAALQLTSPFLRNPVGEDE